MKCKQQIEKLANSIMAEVPGEPSRSEGAVDTAIRIIRDLRGRAKSAEGRKLEADKAT